MYIVQESAPHTARHIICSNSADGRTARSPILPTARAERRCLLDRDVCSRQTPALSSAGLQSESVEHFRFKICSHKKKHFRFLFAELGPKDNLFANAFKPELICVHRSSGFRNALFGLPQHMCRSARRSMDAVHLGAHIGHVFRLPVALALR